MERYFFVVLLGMTRSIFNIIFFCSFNRELIITYVDEDILIARDYFGSPEILRRKDVSRPKTGEYDMPVTEVDNGDSAPGASS